MSFGFSMSGPYPFRLNNDFYSKAPIFDGNGKELGTILNCALEKWNNGRFPSEPGEHRDLNIFETRTVFMDNGYDPPLRVRVPVDLTVSLLVRRQLYYGPVPVPHISEFLDQLSGKVITNAFTVGLLDPGEVEQKWLKIGAEMEAPVKPVIRFVGLVGWYDE